MLKHIEVTGKNQDEAIARALAQLGMDRDDVSVEILELGKTGFLGIGSVPAKVRVTYEAPDEEPEVPVPAPAAEVPVREERPAPEERPPREKRAPREERPPREERRKKQDKPAPEKKPAQSAPEKKPTAPAPEQKPTAPAPAQAEASDDTSAQIAAFLEGLLRHMEVEAVPVITREGDTYSVVLKGEDLGCLIGRRGETLDAVQQLTGYAVNRGRSKRVRIHVDAENYRARREESLKRLANKVAGKVVRYGRSMTLEPMNAYERHVIHSALQDHPSVNTHSTGVEPNRRVVISFEPDKE